MSSGLLRFIEEQIASSAGTPLGQHRAERAAYLARAGRVSEAKAEIASIRADGLLFADSRASSLLNLAEGLCQYYGEMRPLVAEDRFARARAIAQVGGHPDLEGRALSWLGLIQYGRYRFDAMCRTVDECVEKLACGDSMALARTSLTIAISIHLANRFDLAMPWYRRTHLFATERRDEAMISAMLHNMAALWLSNCRNAQLGGPATTDTSRQALAGALSSFNFDGLAGVSALEVLTPLLDAQISSLEMNYQRAEALYKRCRTDFDVQVLHNWSNWMLADLEWCRLNTGVSTTSVDELKRIFHSLSDVEQVDEQAATLARLAGCARLIGQHAWAEQLEESASVSWHRFGELQAQILDLLLSTTGVRLLEEARPL